MKHKHENDISFVAAWLCGAFSPAAPLIALGYFIRGQRRQAFQAATICILALALIIGARGLMLRAGMQNRQSQWLSANAVIFIVFPLIATFAVRALSWPPPITTKPRHHVHQ